MKSKDLKRLNRAELLEILIAQSEEIDRIVALQEIGYAEVGQATNKHRPYVMVGAADSTLCRTSTA